MAISSSLTSRINRAGLPIIKLLSGKAFPPVTKRAGANDAVAADFHAIHDDGAHADQVVRSPMRAPCTIALCPTLTPWPMTNG